MNICLDVMYAFVFLCCISKLPKGGMLTYSHAPAGFEFALNFNTERNLRGISCMHMVLSHLSVSLDCLLQATLSAEFEISGL